MRTLKQIEAARRNGAKSNGPVTAEGKAVSKTNALKHGLAADPAILLTTENDDTYDELLAGYLDTYQPANGAEYDLVCQVVSASWKLRRIGRLEAQILEAQMHLQLGLIDEDTRDIEEATVEGKAFKSLANGGRALDLLVRYTNAARRNYDTALKTLRDLQKERQKAAQNEPEKAKLPAKQTTSKPATILHFPTTNDQTAPPCIEPVEDNIAEAPPQTGAINEGEC